MKICLDARFWSESGIGRYLRNLIGELQQLDRLNEYFILHLKKDYDTLVYPSKNFKKVLADFGWYGVEEQFKLPKLLKRLNPDLIHFPHFNVPIFYDGRFVVTIHDLIHQHFSTREATLHNPFIHQVKKWGYKKVFSHALNRSIKIITPSNFVKDQLVGEWKVDKDKIIVTYEAVEENFIKLSKQVTENDFQKLSHKFNIKKPYLFYIGNAQPHKNILKLINVFGRLKEKCSNLSLVLSGPKHFFWEQIKRKSHIGGVIFTGFVTERELATLYTNAAAFVMPSLEEGFGLPILEAMACKTPVVSSNAASLSEVGGKAALYFDPRSEEDMVYKISQVLENDRLRKKLTEEGQKRYKMFSWDKLAEQTLKVYRRI